MAMPSSRRVVHLIDAQAPGRPLTESYVYRDCPPSVLDTVESDWAKARKRVAWSIFEQNLLGGAGGEVAPLEHTHWDWRNKAESVAAGLHMLVAVESQCDVQGMMAVLRTPRHSQASGKDVVYVDYLESAPWNLKISSSLPRFVGVGTVLIAEAIHISLEMGLEGRVGLHSLPQAKAFYKERCRMSEFGADRSYLDLTYFEYTGQQAIEWIARIGGSNEPRQS
jgi:hypothetical protein